MNGYLKTAVRLVWSFAVALLVLAPVVWLALVAVRDDREVFAGNLKLLPDTVSLAAFAELLIDEGARRPIVNSVVVSVAVAVLSVLLGLTIAAEFVRKQHKGFWFRQLGFALVAARILPVAVTVPGIFWLGLELGFLDRPIGLVVGLLLPALALAVLLLTPSLASIPRSDIEQAAVEGAGGWLMVHQVIWPRIWPLLLIVFLLAFAATWNEFFLSGFIAETSRSQTLSVVVATAIGQYRVHYSVLAAGGLLTVIPAVLVSLSCLLLPGRIGVSHADRPGTRDLDL